MRSFDRFESFVDKVLVIAFLAMFPLAFLVQILSVMLSYRWTLQTFYVLSSGMHIDQIERILGKPSCTIAAGAEMEFPVRSSEKVSPIENVAYCYYGRFPPGRFLAYVDDTGRVARLRFYSDDSERKAVRR